MNAPIPPPHNPYNPYNQQTPPNPSGFMTPEEKNWAVAAHLSAFLSYFTAFLALIAPLIIWLMKKDESVFISNQAKEALNFQITLWIWTLAAVAMFFTFVLIPVSIIIGLGVVLASVICPILGAIQVSNGQPYRYPLTLRLVS